MGTQKLIPMSTPSQDEALLILVPTFEGNLTRLFPIIDMINPAEPRNRYEIVDYTPVTGDSLIPDGGGVTLGETLNK